MTKSNQPMVGLSLSGGGFRATLFHLGALIRLNELGLLSKLNVISSVSGGSILNGFLAQSWERLIQRDDGVFHNFIETVANPIRKFCRQDIRTPLIVGARLNPLHWLELCTTGCSIPASFLSRSYRVLFAEKRIGELPKPSDRVPRFIFCATNVRTGGCWQFHCGADARMGDFYSGYCSASFVKLRDAIAASSAFPFGFSALKLALPQSIEFNRVDPWGMKRSISTKRPPTTNRTLLLTDGGVYDNLGIQPLWNKCDILLSDAGMPFSTVQSSSQFFIPRVKRAADISIEQVGAIRRRWLVEELATRRMKGALWSISSQIADYGLDDAEAYPEEICKLVANVRTDLNSFSDGEISAIENHGYSLADAAIRSKYSNSIVNVNAVFEWPNPEWVSTSKLKYRLKNSHKRRILSSAISYLIGLPFKVAYQTISLFSHAKSVNNLGGTDCIN